MNKYRLWCSTDSKWELVMASTTPTVCPEDAGHTITASSIVVVEHDVLVNDGTAKELALDDYKQFRFNEIDAKTSGLIVAGFTYDSKRFSLSIYAQTNWNVLKDETSEFSWPVEITTLDNDTYSLTEANITAFWTAGRDAVKTLLDSGRALKKSVFDAADESTIDAVSDGRS